MAMANTLAIRNVIILKPEIGAKDYAGALWSEERAWTSNSK
jgi:hypothetical protein